jgi:hypothetical protein
MSTTTRVSMCLWDDHGVFAPRHPATAGRSA